MKNKKFFVIFPIAMMSFSLCALIGDHEYAQPLTAVMKDVGHVENAIPSYVPTDTNYATLKESYHMSPNGLGDIETIWDTYKGDSIKVAIIDNGIDMDHPDFKDKNGNSIISSSSMYIKGNDTDNQVTYYTLKSFPTCLNHNYDVASTSNHGTNVAATLAASINGVGGVGIAPNVELIIFRTAYRYYEVQFALQQCLSLGVDVINMSFEASSSGWTNLSADYKKLNTAGTIICAAAGNKNTSASTYPAHTNYVIGVGALEDNQAFTTKASYSNYNSETTAGINNVDIVAPGQVCVADGSGNGTHTYKDTHGTSFASPIVAGAAALWKQANPGKTQTDFESDLYASATKLNDSNWSQTFGYGRLDIGELINSSVVPVTGVSIDEGDSTTIDVGEDLQLHATVIPSTASDKSVFWISNDEDICTVDEDTGLVHGVSEGTTEVGVLTNDGSFEDSITITVEKESPDPGVYSWKLVEDVSQLKEGSKILFTSGTYVAGGFNTSYFSKLDGLVYSSDNKTITTVPSGATEFLLGKDNNNWTIFQIASPTNKLIGTSSARSLNTTGSGTTTWTISIDNNDFATVACTDSSYGKWMYNVQSPRFCNYTSNVSTTMLLPKLYVWESQQAVSVTGVTISPKSLSLDTSETAPLTATVAPGNATNKNVSYESDAPTIATVSDTGLVTAVSTGTAHITVTTEDGGFTDVATIEVLAAPALTKIYVTGYSLNKVPFGSSYDKSSIVVTAEYERGDDKIVTDKAVIDDPNTKILGMQKVDVSYTENGITKTSYYEVEVTNVGSSSQSKTATIIMNTSGTTTELKSDTISNYYTLSSQSDFSIASNTVTSYVCIESSGFRFGSGSKGGSWVMTLNKAQPITKITLTCLVYGSDGSSITVNGKSLQAPATSSDLVFSITDATTSSISISASAKSKRFYVSAIGITYGQGGTPTTYTAEEQATAWGNYFMSQTDKYCDVTGMDSDIDNLKTIWPTLRTEFENMYSGSKTYFVEQLQFSDAMRRYETIIQRYGEDQFAPFIVDGDGNQYTVPSARFNSNGITNETLSIFVLALPGLLLGIGITYTLYKRRKEN